MLLLAASDNSFTGRIADWAVTVMESLGGPGAGLLIALENLFPPIPSEVILPLAGFTASQGSFSFLGAVVWTTAGSLTGALILYYLGLWLGRDRIRSLAKKLPLVKLSDIDKTEAWFRSHENQTVFWARLVPVVRSLISIPAGIERMPIRSFVLYTMLGSLLWNTILISAGYLLGEQWHLVETYVGVLQYIVLIAIGTALGIFIYRRVHKRRSKNKLD
jgi:membrane protein DedA with SNARE-associated domain